MAASLAARADRRAAEVYQAAIRDALAEGATGRALNTAIRALQSEAAKVRRRRPGAASLTDAELAGSLAAIAASLHAYKPSRPAGCPRVPGPEHLLSVFEGSLARALEGGRYE